MDEFASERRRERASRDDGRFKGSSLTTANVGRRLGSSGPTSPKKSCDDARGDGERRPRSGVGGRTVEATGVGGLETSGRGVEGREVEATEAGDIGRTVDIPEVGTFKGSGV